MNKKKRTRYLLLAVILIYTAVIVRFFMLSSDEEYTVDSLPLASFTPTQYTEKEKFTINNDYRDPFLGTLSRRNQNTKATSSTKSIENKEDAYFPTIKYLGVISDAGSTKKVLSLQINTKEYVTKVGSIVDSVRIISGTTKNLTVSYKGKRKKINISD